MKTFKNQAAQGDVLFRRVLEIPTTAVRRTTQDVVVIAHSETGHNHQFNTAHGVEVYDVGDPLVCYLRIADSALLEHMRPFDTHEALLFGGGTYEVRRQREYTPAGWRRVED